MELRNRVREVAEDAKERTEAASRRGRGAGDVVARETANVGAKACDELLGSAASVRETAESVHGRMDGKRPDGTMPEASTIVATTDKTAAMLAFEIQQFLDGIDHRYAAKSGLKGARHGYVAGPYGAVLGGGVGTMYGAYRSTLAAFDPENPSRPVGEAIDTDRYLDGARDAKTGFKIGKSFGTKGKIAGTAVGVGMSLLPILAERMDDSMNGETTEFDDERLSAVTERVPDRPSKLPKQLPFEEHIGRGVQRTAELVSQNGETFLQIGAMVVETDWSGAHRAATESFAAFRERAVD